MTYREKLLDPRWQKKRLEIFDRDDFSCKKCGGKTKTLHVHHLFYQSGKEPWDYENKYLITLCHECHESETLYYQQAIADLLHALRENQYLSDNIEALACDIQSGNYEKRELFIK